MKATPFVEGTIYVTRNSSFVNNPHVLKSVDYGNNWQNITNDLPDIGTNAIVVNPLNNNYLYIATDLGVFASENGGQNWVEYNDGMPVTFSLDLNYNIIEQTLRVGTFGRGIWKTSAIPDEILETPSINNSLLTISVYPNPTEGPIYLAINMINAASINVKLYNLNGQLISILYNDFVNKGNQHIALSENDEGFKIPSGIYFIKITINEKSVTKKLVVK